MLANFLCLCSPFCTSRSSPSVFNQLSPMQPALNVASSHPFRLLHYTPKTTNSCKSSCSCFFPPFSPRVLESPVPRQSCHSFAFLQCSIYFALHPLTLCCPVKGQTSFRIEFARAHEAVSNYLTRAQMSNYVTTRSGARRCERSSPGSTDLAWPL